MTVRVLIADDHPFYREGIKSLLGTKSRRVDVVGEAASGEEAIELCVTLRPNVVLMDLQMPGIGGIAATERIAANYPDIAVLVLTMLDNDSVLSALRAGARGYLLKDAGVDDVIRAIETVAAGLSVLGPSAAERVGRQLNARSAARPFPELTDREHDLLAQILSGRSTREIALNLDLAEKTVRNYVSNILMKLHARDRAHLIAIALEAGYPEGT